MSKERPSYRKPWVCEYNIAYFIMNGPYKKLVSTFNLKIKTDYLPDTEVEQYSKKTWGVGY